MKKVIFAVVLSVVCVNAFELKHKPMTTQISPNGMVWNGTTWVWVAK
jgi:hypothetical protein